MNLLVTLNSSKTYGNYCANRVKSTEKARKRRKNDNSMQKILCKETRCHDGSVYQSVPSKCIISHHISKCNNCQFAESFTDTNALAPSMQHFRCKHQRPRRQRVFSYSMPVCISWGKPTVRFVQYINILHQWCHMKEQYRDQQKNTTSQVQCPRKIQYKNFFMVVHGLY